jgi:hypothetical protein
VNDTKIGTTDDQPRRHEAHEGFFVRVIFVTS